MVTRTRLAESAIRPPQAVPEKPAKTSECTTPRRAQASIATGRSGTIGRWKVTLSPLCRPQKPFSMAANSFTRPVELLVSYGLCAFGLRLGDPDKRRLVGLGREVAVDAVVTGVEPAPDEPLPKRRVGGVESGMPVRVPVEQVGVLPEALGKALFAEALVNGGLRRVRLADEARPRGTSTPPPANARLSETRLATPRSPLSLTWATSFFLGRSCGPDNTKPPRYCAVR